MSCDDEAERISAGHARAASDPAPPNVPSRPQPAGQQQPNQSSVTDQHDAAFIQPDDTLWQSFLARYSFEDVDADTLAQDREGPNQEGVEADRIETPDV